MNKIRNKRVSGGTLLICTAGVAIATMMLRFPIVEGIRGASGTLQIGYLNLGDIAVLYVGLRYGLVAGLIAGGAGSAIADIAGGYAGFALITFFAKALEGGAAGLLVEKKRPIAARCLPGLAMVLSYLVGEGHFMPAGSWEEAFTELPFNCIQWLLAVGVNAYIFWALGLNESGVNVANENDDRLAGEEALKFYSFIMVYLGLLATVGIIRAGDMQHIVQISAGPIYLVVNSAVAGMKSLVIDLDSLLLAIISMILYLMFVFTLVLVPVRAFGDLKLGTATRQERTTRVVIAATALFCLVFSMNFFNEWQRLFEQNLAKIRTERFDSIQINPPVGTDSDTPSSP